MAQPPKPMAQVTSGDGPPWIWLLIGVFLGAGGTLFSASLWLPDTPVASAGLEAKEIPRSPDDGAATAASAGDHRQIAELEVDAAAEPAEGAGGAMIPVPEPTIEQTAAATEAPTAEVSETPAPQTSTLETATLETAASETSPETVAADDLAPNDGEQENMAHPALEIVRQSQEPVVVAETANATIHDERRTEPPAAAASADITRTKAPASRGDKVAPEDAIAALIEKSRRLQTASVQPRSARPQTERGAPPLVTRTATAGPSGSGRERLYRVQLAAVDDEAAARVFWREVNQRLPGVFDDVQPIFDRRQVDRKEYHRVWVGAFDRHADAIDYCGWLKGQGQDCFVTRVDNL